MKHRRDVFQAIADPTRRAILTLLAINAMTPGALADHFATTRQTVSKHIQILSECDIITQMQTGREIFYQLNANKLTEVAEWLRPFAKMWDDRFDKIEALI